MNAVREDHAVIFFHDRDPSSLWAMGGFSAHNSTNVNKNTITVTATLLPATARHTSLALDSRVSPPDRLDLTDRFDLPDKFDSPDSEMRLKVSRTATLAASWPSRRPACDAVPTILS